MRVRVRKWLERLRSRGMDSVPVVLVIAGEAVFGLPFHVARRRL